MAFRYDGAINNGYGITEFFPLLIRNILSLMCLNVVFIVCCIPVVTIPAAVAAINRTAWMLTGGETQGVLKRFFKTFRNDFFKSMPLTLTMAVCQAGALYGIWFYYNTNKPSVIAFIPMFVCLALFIFLYLIQMYALIIMAVADIPTLKIIKNSVVLICMYPGRSFGWGIFSLIVLIAGLWFYPFSLPILALILFSLVYYINAYCTVKNINKHIIV